VVKIWPSDLDLWPWKSIGFQILVRPKYVPSLVKIHWRMLILECSQGCYGRTDGNVIISLRNFIGEGIIKWWIFLAWTKFFQWLSGFITFTLEMKQFHLLLFFCFLSIWSHQIIRCYSAFSISSTVLTTLSKRLQTTVTERLYSIIDMYVRSRENLKHH
jgi:hypothetical protein